MNRPPDEAGVEHTVAQPIEVDQVVAHSAMRRCRGAQVNVLLQ